MRPLLAAHSRELQALDLNMLGERIDAPAWRCVDVDPLVACFVLTHFGHSETAPPAGASGALGVGVS